MNKISVLMPTYNCGKFVGEAIESVLNQSFQDFQFIIVDDGSTDNTLSVVKRYKDDRIFLIQNRHDYIGSLNIGLQHSQGKYIARMDADDVMHVDRLLIQYMIMENNQEIDVCSSWMSSFGDGVNKRIISYINGIIEYPLRTLLNCNFISHPTVLFRKAFLDKYNLKYEQYDYAEDFKFWSEIAKKNGVFYVESQPLLFYRVSTDQVTQKYKKEQMNTTIRVKKEIIDFLTDKLLIERENVMTLNNQMRQLNDADIISNDSYFNMFYDIFCAIDRRSYLNNCI